MSWLHIKNRRQIRETRPTDFRARWTELETAVLATAWNDILGRLNSTSISLQDPTVSLNAATG